MHRCILTSFCALVARGTLRPRASDTDSDFKLQVRVTPSRQFSSVAATTLSSRKSAPGYRWRCVGDGLARVAGAAALQHPAHQVRRCPRRSRLTSQLRASERTGGQTVSAAPSQVADSGRLQTASVITWSVLRAWTIPSERPEIPAMVVPAFFLLLCSLPPFWPLVIGCMSLDEGSS